ncbi:MAG: RDD family protein [Candidatus Dactylopiibacterium sp.]|nr:RDD family protein [Candidatus Dactylopiibacterium sp.]
MPTLVEYASLRRRLSSLLYESLLLLGILAAGFLLPLIALGMIFHVALPGALEWLYLFVLLGAYFIWLWRRNGQTLAMQTWQLQLVDVRTGQPPALSRCLLRYALAWPSTLLTLSGVGLIWAAFVDRDRQFAHDRLAGTCIVFNPHARQEAR